MSNHSDEPDASTPGDDDEAEHGAGVEITSTDGEGSSFEPEEDPEAPDG